MKLITQRGEDVYENQTKLANKSGQAPLFVHYYSYLSISDLFHISYKVIKLPKVLVVHIVQLESKLNTTMGVFLMLGFNHHFLIRQP